MIRKLVAILALAVLLFSPLARAVPCDGVDVNMQWCWEKITHPDLAGYRVYWAFRLPAGWYGGRMIDVPLAEVGQACNDPNTHCAMVDTPPPGMVGEVQFVVVTAYSDTEETDTEHGPVYVCP